MSTIIARRFARQAGKMLAQNRHPAAAYWRALAYRAVEKPLTSKALLLAVDRFGTMDYDADALAAIQKACNAPAMYAPEMAVDVADFDSGHRARMALAALKAIGGKVVHVEETTSGYESANVHGCPDWADSQREGRPARNCFRVHRIEGLTLEQVYNALYIDNHNHWTMKTRIDGLHLYERIDGRPYDSWDGGYVLLTTYRSQRSSWTDRDHRGCPHVTYRPGEGMQAGMFG